jgi:hypothetical protein
MKLSRIVLFWYAANRAHRGDLSMITRNEEFNNINDLMSRFGGRVYEARPKNRGYTRGDNEGEHLVHVLTIGHQGMEEQGVTNTRESKISWDKIYMESINGGLQPDQSPKKQALFVKDVSIAPPEKVYTFRGIYEVDAESTDFRFVFRRLATEIDETDPKWRIVRQG